MNRRRSLVAQSGLCLRHRGAAVAAVVFEPAARRTESPGGKLAQLRDEYGLSQADLGEIDPTSEALKLATLGMRGPAANIMWQKANEYKKTEDWMAFSAALEQIIRLQPNFINVWRFQAWNLSYNISVEFDDYHDRYYWVMKGINFIIGGTRYNKNEPRLLYDVGWFIAQKIGRADEQTAIPQAVQGGRRLQRQSQAGRSRQLARRHANGICRLKKRRRQIGHAGQGNHAAGVSFLSVDGADRLFRSDRGRGYVRRSGQEFLRAKPSNRGRSSATADVPTTYNTSIH